MTYDHWKTTDDSWQGDPADNMVEDEPTAQVVLDISQVSPDYFHCVDAENYDGPGDICGTGRSREEAAADWAEQYAERAYVRALTEAYDEINALGGVDRQLRPDAIKGRGFWTAFGYNHAIDNALDLLVKRGALTIADRKRRNDR